MTDNLTRKQKKAVKALLEHPTIDQAARAIGVNPRTIYRWMDDRFFRAALSRAEGEALDSTTRKLLILGDRAVNALASILDDPTQPGASNRRLAAKAILDHLLKLRELRSVEQRLTDLEAVIYGEGKNPKTY